MAGPVCVGETLEELEVVVLELELVVDTVTVLLPVEEEEVAADGQDISEVSGICTY